MTTPQIALLIGGAGTGKTTELLNIMEKAKSALGGSPFSIGFTSFTRAARAEAVSRAASAWNVPEDVLSHAGWFRTVHSIAHRQLGVKKGELIDDSKESCQWIADALNVNVRTVIDDDTGYSKYVGERSAAMSLNCWELARARMEPLATTIRRLSRGGNDVPSFALCKQYVERYEQAKRVDGRFDFSDLLSRFSGVRFTVDGWDETDPEGELPPSVKAWVMDEQQDASALVDAACRRLAYGDNVQWVYLAGDPMQSIFGFGGSDSRHFMSWKVDKKRVMPKSWRCPQPVHDLGEKCLKMMKNGYWDRGIAAADHDGAVVRGGYCDSVCAGLSATDETLIVARCNYTLDMWQSALEKNGLPFAQLKAKNHTKFLRGVNALWEIEHGNPASAEDFSCAVAMLPATGNMERGAKKQWENESTVRSWEVVFPADLEQAGMKPEFAEKLRGGHWGDLFTGGSRWKKAAKKYGPELATTPKIRVGTIHAAKGMEADTVILSTTISRRIYESQGYDSDQHDEERRVEYVGVTRARRKLVLATEPGADYRMRIQA